MNEKEVSRALKEIVKNVLKRMSGEVQEKSEKKKEDSLL